MTGDVASLLERTTPEHLPGIDVAALRRIARRRRRAKRAGSVAGLALVAVALVSPALLRQPPPVRFAAPATDWASLDYQEAVAELRATARDKAAIPPGPQGGVESRAIGFALREMGSGEADERWLAPFQSVWRQDQHGGRAVVGSDEAERVPVDTPMEELRARAADMAAGPWRNDLRVIGDGDDPGAMDEAEELSSKPAPFVPAPGETERPDRLYALMRLTDALRTHPADPAMLDRAFGVLERLGDQWATYRGPEQDLLGRQTVAFSWYDTANDSENVLQFDPETGRLLGEMSTFPVSRQPSVVVIAAFEHRGV